MDSNNKEALQRILSNNKEVIQRILKEYTELHERITNLNKTFALPCPYSIPDKQMDLLNRQMIHMIDYRKVLRDRYISLSKESTAD